MNKAYPYLSEAFLKRHNIYSNSLARFSFPYYALSRGLTVSWLNIKNQEKYKVFYRNEGVGGVYKITDGVKEFSFNFSRVLNAHQDENIVRKDKLFNLLSSLGIKYPKQRSITKVDADKLTDIQFPVVVKPIYGSMGKGVYVDIQNYAELEVAIKKQTSAILIEEYIEGDEYRIYVLNGKPIAYCKRHEPFIIGDGKKTVAQLISEFNLLKIKKNLAQVKLDEDLNLLLKGQGKDINDILGENEIIVLSYKKGRSSGAIIENVKSINYEVYESLRAIGLALNHFFLLGIDCIVKNDTLYVLEINLRPQISSAMLPDIGVPVNISKLVIDSLFGPYIGDYTEPQNFTKKLKILDSINEIDWSEMKYQVGSEISVTLK